MRDRLGKSLVSVVDSRLLPVYEELDRERSILGDTVEVLFVAMDQPGAAGDMLSRSDALIVGSAVQFGRDLLEKSSRARVIVRNGVGFDNIDIEAARLLGIPVCNVPDYGTEEVADHAMMLVLALERRLASCTGAVRSGKWSWRAAQPCRRLRGQRFGIVGCGRIGTAVALRAKAFGFLVWFYDPYVAAGYEKAIGTGRAATLHELLESSDVVSLHAPLTAETRGIIGTAEFDRLKAGAFLVNTARGPLVQEDALISALAAGRLAGAALDVLEHEPAFSAELLNHPNCLLTPHAAFYSIESLEDMRANAAGTVRRVLLGGAPVNVVNGLERARGLAAALEGASDRGAR